MKKILLFSLILILANSCVIQGTLQGLFTYQRPYVREMPGLFSKVVDCDSSTIDYKPKKVLVLNGNTLRNCISGKRDVIYIWPPRCHSELCIPLNLLQRRCEDLNVNLYIVAQYYDLQEMNVKYNIEHALMAIDNRYYNTIFVTNQLQEFLSDLTEVKHISDYQKMFYLFVNKEYVRSANRLSELVNQTSFNTNTSIQKPN